MNTHVPPSKTITSTTTLISANGAPRPAGATPACCAAPRGAAIEAWQAVRPDQPAILDPKTNERADFLFAFRAHRVSKHYINETIIPMLWRKPAPHFRRPRQHHQLPGPVHHRQPALQRQGTHDPVRTAGWLGHRTPEATAHYAKITPNALAKAYNDASYFARKVRTVEVLVDRDAVASGAAANGDPWQYYDLGHGRCTYTFFEQCQHRTACARCDFYTPKASSKGQLLEAKENLQKMLAAIPLTDDERAAVDGQTALDQLLARLTDVPTPPRWSHSPADQQATLLPVIEINRRPTGQQCSAAQPVSDVIRVGRTDLNAILVQAIDNPQAATVEDELHCHGSCRQITVCWPPLKQRDLSQFLTDERLQSLITVRPLRRELGPLPPGDGHHGVDRVPADREEVELRVTNLHLDAVEVQHHRAVGKPVPVFGEPHQCEPRQTPTSERRQT
ncbi:hypothetical protein GCM10010495_77610 [Kitasatospora herbaricolor]|uniref:hypothetical protein n=1 Tax=Kitasatospora herbaricolor TaxID=68217 RepID=UPI00199AAA09|nr:hypothetical protein [Kitasatospora herbaricolor]MDQ0305550.1 hypothetical protein [Kitasatospora herbaricolor]GGV48294.1 hypothetical protein GCM10010495_77610 [Kitasatospora herbaricolor]